MFWFVNVSTPLDETGGKKPGVNPPFPLEQPVEDLLACWAWGREQGQWFKPCLQASLEPSPLYTGGASARACACVLICFPIIAFQASFMIPDQKNNTVW